MFHYFFVIALILFSFSFQSMSFEQAQLEKFRSVITTEFKGYDISNTESIQLYGAKHRKFINQNLYWGEAGYGALFGKRSGYLEGGVFVGHMGKGPMNTIFDVRLFSGAGGGGAAPQGGGIQA